MSLRGGTAPTRTIGTFSAISHIADAVNVPVMAAGSMLEGDLENGYISVGNVITYIHEIRPVKALIEDLMRDFV